jgi:hypothetical protein
MNIQRIRTNPHDHSPNALSYFGVVRLPNDEYGNPRFMCLTCHEVFTVPAAKRLKHGFWVCPYSCNEDFTSDKPDPQSVVWAMYAIVRQFHNEAVFVEALRYVMDNINNIDPLCFNWRDALQTILGLADDAKVKPGVFGSALALNALRHYVAHLAKHFNELVPDGTGTEGWEKKRLLEKVVVAGMPQNDPKALIEPLVDAACYMLGMAPIELLRIRGDHNEAVCACHRAYKRAYKTGLMNPHHVKLMEEMFHRFKKGRPSGRLELPNVDEWEESLDELFHLTSKASNQSGSAPTIH